MRTNRWIALSLFLLAAFVVAAIGGLATASSVRTWYPLLNKPSWTPPSWLFGPAWTTLYVLMSVAAWRIWSLPAQTSRTTVLRLHALQLGLNALWSVLFFGLQRPDLALVEVGTLWLVLAYLQRRLWPLDRLAAALWLPYLAWVSFASALNASVWWLNRG
jgi:translocator protein